MNAISLYVSASRLLFNQSDVENPNYSDLYRLVPYLRQSLSCTVCSNLLVDPYTAENAVCQHHVCRMCIGGRKNLKPTCSSCKNYHKYNANHQLRILLQCYKSLCCYISATPSVYDSMHNYIHVDACSNGSEAQNLAELIDEGARFHDEYTSTAGLPKSKISILPCIFTTTSSSVSTNQSQSCSGTTINSAATTEASFIQTSSNQPICITPCVSTSSKPNEVVTVMNSTKTAPIKTVSNGTALYSVLYTGSGNKITIKRKTDDNMFTTANTMSTKDVINILSRNPAKITPHPQIQQIQPVHTSKPLKTVPQPHIIQTHAQTSGLVTAQSTSFKKPSIALKTNRTMQKRKGCRCGNATATPGKLTCCGQRCPCYVESKSCIDCKCRGCRNPHRLDGFKVRPQLTCLVQMNNQSFEKNYVDVPMESFGNNSTSETKIKQEIMPIPFQGNAHQILSSRVNPQMDLPRTNESIEYVSNDLDDDNIQVVNVYTTTHMPEISTTLPSIIMQDEASVLNHSATALHNHLSLPSDSYSLIGEDLIKHSFSDDDSSEDQSDVEIDL